MITNLSSPSGPCCFDPESESHAEAVSGRFTKILFAGRTGWRGAGIDDRIAFPFEQSAYPQGSLRMWMLPLEELSHRSSSADERKAHPGTDATNYIFIGDHPDLQNVRDSRFAVIWGSGWYPQYWAKFFEGHLYHQGFQPERKLFALAGHAEFKRLRWVQLGLTWDLDAVSCSLYVNGVCVGRNPTDAPLTFDACAKTLYTGHPSFAVGEVVVEPRCCSDAEMESIYRREATDRDEEEEAERRHHYLGGPLPSLDFTPDAEWENKLEVPFTSEEDLRHFYVQGKTDSVSITPDGLQIKTGEHPCVPGTKEDLQQMYLWTEDRFEGDLYVSYEYRTLRRSGLSLLLTQAGGLQGEDFMADYPRRTTGSMSMVCWENVRNYHWEYFREMVDTQQDRATFGLIKNPWRRPLAFQALPEKPELNVWNRLEFLQQGNRIRGAINGHCVFDVTDDGHAGHGPVFRQGHLAIRCMWGCHIHFRNLQVWNRKDSFLCR